MLTLLQNVIAYASQGPQELCLAIAVLGFFVPIFGRPIGEAKPKATAKRGAKQPTQCKPKTKSSKPRKAKAKRPKRKENNAKPKQRETPRSYSVDELERLDNYFNDRRI